MLKKLSDVTAAWPLGSPTGQKLFRVPSGPQANRLVSLFASDAGTIMLSWSDSPYLSWSTPQAIISNTGNNPFDAVMDAQGNLIVAYTDGSSARLVSRRLNFSSTGWTAASQVTVYDGSLGYDPCLAISPGGTVWLVWNRTVVPSSWIHAKSSADGGATWGSGPADSGDQISGAAMFLWSKLLIGPSHIHVFSAYGNSAITLRSLPLSGGTWSTESTIYSSAGVGSEFDIALTDSGGLALVVCDALPRYREFDGFTWGAVQQLDSHPAYSPQVQFQQGNPIVLFVSGLGPDQSALKYTVRLSGVFQPPDFVDRQARTFDRVLLYHAASASYHDATATAADSTTGDVYHPQSGALVAAVGDKVYVGLDDRFRFLTILLSTVGAGGSVSTSYWDGSGWKSFTPVSGASNLSAATNQLLLWTDYQSIPQDWQKSSVNGNHRFWVKVEATSAFTTAPVGYQITALSDIRQITVRR